MSVMAFRWSHTALNGRADQPMICVMPIRSANDPVVMAPAAPEKRVQRQEMSRLRMHRKDAWLACEALMVALLVLPLGQSTWHGPEVAAVMAIAATSLFAGQRWAISVIVIAEVCLLPTVWPRAFLEGDLDSRLVALVTLGAMVPGLLAMRRAAAVLVLVTCEQRTRLKCRRVHVAMMAVLVIAVAIPLL